MSDGLRSRIIGEYHQTTSGISNSYATHLEKSLQQLRGRMGPWMPRPGQAVLDLGCGHGELLLLFARGGCQDLTGVNLCREELDVAATLVKAELVCQDAVSFVEQAGRQYDLITCFNFLEHLTKDDLFRCLAGIHRILKPGGRLVAMVPNAASPFSGVTRHWDLTHEWAFTLSNFRQLAQLTGFDSAVEGREAGPIPHGLVSGIRWLLWQGIRSAIRFYMLVETASLRGGVYTMDMIVSLRKKGDREGKPA